MLCDTGEVFVCREERQLVAYAELRKQRIDRADLDTGLSTRIAQAGRTDVVFPVGLKQRQSGEPLDDLAARLGAREPLQEFLENETRREDDVGTEQGILQLAHLRPSGLPIAAKGKRPNAGIDQESHFRRDRSAL